MLKNRLIPRIAIVLVLVAGLVAARFTRDAAPSAHPVEIRGEPIRSAITAETPTTSESATNVTAGRRHPKPPSVQRRMVLAALAEANGSNSDGASLSSGTAGTSADLAKTNLVSASSLPPLPDRPAGFSEVSFKTLSGFDFAITGGDAEAAAGTAIPESVRAWDGREVVIQGFLLPVRMDDGLAVEFLLMRNQSMCCYGVAPKINEWISVAMSGKGVAPLMDRPIAVAGTLHVGPFLENGLLTGLYRMEGEKVIGPP